MKFRNVAAAVAALSLTVAPVAAQAATARTAAPASQTSKDSSGLGSFVVPAVAIALIVLAIILATKKNNKRPVSA